MKEAIFIAKDVVKKYGNHILPIFENPYDEEAYFDI